MSQFIGLGFCFLQRMASDFLSNYIFLAVGRVGSSTDLIVQRVEYVQETDKRDLLLHILHAQQANGAYGRVCRDIFSTVEFSVMEICMLLLDGF